MIYTMDKNFDYETAKIIVENNYGFAQMRNDRIFSFDKYCIDNNCSQWDGKRIIDGCDEYFCSVLTKSLCEQLSKGFADLAMCFKETLE